MEAPGHVPSVPSPKSGTGTSSALLNVSVCLRDGDSISWSFVYTVEVTVCIHR